MPTADGAVGHAPVSVVVADARLRADEPRAAVDGDLGHRRRLRPLARRGALVPLCASVLSASPTALVARRAPDALPVAPAANGAAVAACAGLLGEGARGGGGPVALSDAAERVGGDEEGGGGDGLLRRHLFQVLRVERHRVLRGVLQRIER